MLESLQSISESLKIIAGKEGVELGGNGGVLECLQSIVDSLKIIAKKSVYNKTKKAAGK